MLATAKEALQNLEITFNPRMQPRTLSTLLKPYICPSCTRSLERRARRYATVMSQSDLYDVVCVGGGPAGLSILTALRTCPSSFQLRRYITDYQFRIFSQDLQSPPCPNRVSTPFPFPRMVSSSRSLLKPCLFPDPLLPVFPFSYSSLAPHRPIPYPTLPPHAGLGWPLHQRPHLLLLSFPWGPYSHHGREPESHSRPTSTIG